MVTFGSLGGASIEDFTHRLAEASGLGVKGRDEAVVLLVAVKYRIKVGYGLEGALSRLLLLRERYLDVKANENFLRLQDELAGTENRVAVERKRYNTAVQAIKTFGREFFGRMFCNCAGVDTDEFAYFQAEAAAQKGAPKVEF